MIANNLSDLSTEGARLLLVLDHFEQADISMTLRYDADRHLWRCEAGSWSSSGTTPLFVVESAIRGSAYLGSEKRS